jgi:hypothetical protein
MYHVAQVSTDKELTLFQNCFGVYFGFTTEWG